MKYQLVLAEDEPEAAENIFDILHLYCPQFELAASAENGLDALELAHKHHPDLLLTDIKMPVMNGLDLIKRLHKELPEIKTIILSGYQDFEYARTALQYGAVDYLLKPISPQTLKATLNRLVPYMENENAQKRLGFIQELLAGGTKHREDLYSLFPAPGYYAGLCRKNGLAGRFLGVKRIFPPPSRVSENSIDIYGKDDMECLHIEQQDASIKQYENHRPNSPTGPAHWEKVQWLNQEVPGYRTIVFTNKPFPIKDLPGVMEELYTTLTHSLVIGKSQVLVAGTKNQEYQTENQSFASDNTIAHYLNYYLKEKKNGKIKETLQEQLRSLEKQEIPQYRVENGVRSFMEQILLFSPEIIRPDERIEILIDDAFYYATDYKDLEKNLLYVLEKLLPPQELNLNKIDTPEFFNLIEDYIKTKLTEALSLQQTCVHFGISQTYMSRLFRKYTGLSFVNYLTRCRIEQAKQYLQGGNTLIKDAAALTGYSDQFYFSKVFKSLTGESPSDFIRGEGTIPPSSG